MKTFQRALLVLAIALWAIPAAAFGGARWDSWAHRPWIVRDAPGVAGWYAASVVSVSGANITSWTDQSGNGRDLSAEAASPTLVASVYNGQPTARFVAASSQSMSRASTDIFGTGAWAIFAVAKGTGSENNCGVAGDWTASGGAGIYVNGVSISALHPGVSGFTDSAAGSTLSLWSAVRAAASKPAFWTNQVTQSLGGAATTMAAAGGSGKLGIGDKNQGGSNTFDGDIAEVVFVAGSIDATTQFLIEKNLRTKYGI